MAILDRAIKERDKRIAERAKFIADGTAQARAMQDQIDKIQQAIDAWSPQTETILTNLLGAGLIEGRQK